ncbi:stalk domain-containing protein [Paenibacillus filicis]|uniref:Stalk domain-containing protein n=1 Tax=Paenibacillus filicis TaxID=669464 RepID=A0ABU9DC10_9BACL
MMRRWYRVMSICLLSLPLAWPGAVAAENQTIPVYLNGNPVSFEVPPILEDGTTLVQFRPIFERLGLTIGWDEATRTVTGSRNGLNIKLVIDELEASVNNQQSELDLAPRLVEGNTFVPLRFVGEASGAEVVWDGENGRIYLRTGSSPGGSNPGTGTPPKDPEEASPPTKGNPDKGTYTYPNGDIYTGQMAGGKPAGKGKLVDAGGKLLFDGTMAGGVPSEGKYKTYHPNGKVSFDGQIKDGVLSGAGKQYSDIGKLVFTGIFAAGERESGTLTEENGDKYTGEFERGEPNGKGKMVYKNGDSYEGNFLNGKREGKGTYTTSKGEKIEGDFQNNLKNGVIRHYDSKGNLLSVSEYVNDVQISKVNVGKDAGDLPNTTPPTQSPGITQENTRHDKAVKDIKDRYDANKKTLEDQMSQIRKDNPGMYASQAAYDKALKDANTKQASLQAKLASLGSSPGKAVEAAREEVMKQLDAVHKLIFEIQSKGAAQQQVENLKFQLTQAKNRYDAELKQENTSHAEIIKKLK